MATANFTEPLTEQAKPLAADAMRDLCKFINVTNENQQALAVWNEYIKQERPVIDVAIDEAGEPVFSISKPLGAFISTAAAV